MLQCEDTYPDFASHAEWYGTFRKALDAWLDGHEDALPALGRMTPVKHWLARLLRHRLVIYEGLREFGPLVGLRVHGRSGTGTV